MHKLFWTALLGVQIAGGAQAAVKVLNQDAYFPEGPVWYQGKLYYVEYGRNAVMTWDGKPPYHGKVYSIENDPSP